MKPLFNRRFAAKAIDDLQHRSILDGLFVQASTQFLYAIGLLAWDEAHGLFWVEHPEQGWQVAVWLMPVAEILSPSVQN